MSKRALVVIDILNDIMKQQRDIIDRPIRGGITQ